MSEAKWEVKGKAALSFNKADSRHRRRWRDPETGKWRSQLNSRWVWERANGPIPEGCIIHHIDGDKTNDALDNLRLMASKEHLTFHARLRQHRIIDGIEHKWCLRCRSWKSLDHFHMRSNLMFYGCCRECGQDSQ